MALFSRSKKTTDAPLVTAPKPTVARTTDRDLTTVLVSPVVTEKAVMQQDRRVYVFYIRKDATKFLVREAVKVRYGVTPVSVNIVNKITRQTVSQSRGRKTKVSGYKKAYVTLKTGDSITLV
jgi:large subunit ribosomal protein L23